MFYNNNKNDHMLLKLLGAFALGAAAGAGAVIAAKFVKERVLECGSCCSADDYGCFPDYEADDCDCCNNDGTPKCDCDTDTSPDKP